ncbi:phospholipase A1-like [Diachasmimorpha longicaudata]|uniref:phospholipase A1-like n=1 Tax=Diachasmimorpha longicaudata TaxID=58733 RepID=UPI0030B8C5D4
MIASKGAVVLWFLTYSFYLSSSRIVPQNTSLSHDFHEKRVNYMYKWPNGSSITWHPERSLASQNRKTVDCLGIGDVAAAGLEWFFKKNTSDSVDVRFFLSSSRRPHRVRVLVGPQFGLEWTDFSVQRRTVIIVHGFLSHGGEDWIREMEEAFHAWGDVNVVVVDWSAHGNTWNYYSAAVNARIVGHQISRLLSHIVNTTRESTPDETSWGPIHMVGHSLGAHICGITANHFRMLPTSWKIRRITGLDPAQPCFKYSDLSLNKSHAPLVDIIHTNGKWFSSIGLGLPGPIGHMDFYPNGGKRQPACIKIEASSFDYLGIPKSAVEQAICSHGFSHAYFTESVRSAASKNCSFCGRSWDLTYRHAQQIINETTNPPNICVEMGLKAENASLRGTFFVMTSSTTPFCDVNFGDHTETLQHLREDFIDEIRD